MSGVVVNVMAKAPTPGSTKRRLRPVLGTSGCARLSRRMLWNTLTRVRDAAVGPVVIRVAGWRGHPALREAADEFGVSLRSQRGSHLGARMAGVVRGTLGEGSWPVLVGTDCPSLSPKDLREAASALSGGAEVVLGPATDGGYWLLGCRGPVEFLFRRMPWGGPAVLAETLRRCERARLSVALLGERRDLDRPGDLAGLSPFDVLFGDALQRLGEHGDHH